MQQGNYGGIVIGHALNPSDHPLFVKDAHTFFYTMATSFVQCEVVLVKPNRIIDHFGRPKLMLCGKNAVQLQIGTVFRLGQLLEAHEQLSIFFGKPFVGYTEGKIAGNVLSGFKETARNLIGGVEEYRSLGGIVRNDQPNGDRF
jgi:hypothetical protein